MKFSEQLCNDIGNNWLNSGIDLDHHADPPNSETGQYFKRDYIQIHFMGEHIMYLE